MIDLDALTATVNSWDDPADGEAIKSRELILHLLRESAEPLSRRQYAPGHITGTACVIHPDSPSVLLVHHRKLNRWLLPGGHVEPDFDPLVSATARREAEEETGVHIENQFPPRLVGIDVHAIPGRKKEPFHLHHDLMFAFRAQSPTMRMSEEIRDVVWCPLERFDHFAVPHPIRRAVLRALNGKL